MKTLTLVRRDDSNFKIELVRFQDPATLPYFFGQTQAMLDEHLAAAIFPRSVWKAGAAAVQRLCDPETLL